MTVAEGADIHLIFTCKKKGTKIYEYRIEARRIILTSGVRVHSRGGGNPGNYVTAS